MGFNSAFKGLNNKLQGDALRTGRTGDRFPVGAGFSAPVQTGSEAHQASCTMVTGSFPEVKLPARGAYHSPASSVEVKERVQLYLYSPSARSWPVLEWTLLLLLLYFKEMALTWYLLLAA